MFWKKAPQTVTPRPTDNELFAQRIAEAHAKGDERTALTYRLLLISIEAEKIRESMESIVENYSDGLTDLTRDACHLFPLPLAVEIMNLERLISDNFEVVESLAEAVSTVMSQLVPLQLAKDSFNPGQQ